MLASNMQGPGFDPQHYKILKKGERRKKNEKERNRDRKL
jgi:hypothetical protein